MAGPLDRKIICNQYQYQFAKKSYYIFFTDAEWTPMYSSTLYQKIWPKWTGTQIIIELTDVEGSRRLLTVI